MAALGGVSFFCPDQKGEVAQHASAPNHS
jgi:hypothetical protein